MPSPVLWFQSTFPDFRSMHIASSALFCASAVEVKTLSPNTTGVEALGPGISTAHAADSLLNSVAKPFSSVDPLKFGPRHCGQSAAIAEIKVDAAAMTEN